MQAVVDASDFGAAVKSVAPISSGKYIPILGNLRLIAEGGRIAIQATDTKIYGEGSCAAETEEDGSITADAGLIDRFARRARGDITIRMAGTEVELRTDSANVSLPTLPSDQFPNFEFERGEEIAAPDVLADALKFVTPAVSSEEVRVYLNGARIDGEYVVATCGHRLHRMPFDSPCQGIIPGLYLSKLIASLKLDGARFYMSERSWTAVSPWFRFRGPYVDGNYPDWRRVQANDPRVVFVADRDVVADAIGTATLGNGGGIRITVHKPESDDGRPEVEVFSPSLAHSKVGYHGDGSARFLANADSHEATEVTVNSPYLLDAITSMPEGDVAILEAQPSDAGPYEVRSCVNDGLRTTIMGMRI